MDCPIDGTPLQMADRQGIEIDYCPTCRGIWLDRGELDKIIERSVGQLPGGAPAASPYPVQNEPYPPYEDLSRQGGHGQSGHHGQGYGGRGKRRSFLGDLFDF